MVSPDLYLLGAGDLCEELRPSFSRSRDLQRLYRRRPGEDYLSKEQPSRHSAGQSAVAHSGEPSEINSQQNSIIIRLFHFCQPFIEYGKSF